MILHKILISLICTVYYWVLCFRHKKIRYWCPRNTAVLPPLGDTAVAHKETGTDTDEGRQAQVL